MSNILSSILTSIDGARNEHELLIRLIIAVAALVLLVLFKNQISKGVAFVICKILFSKSERAQRAVTQSIIRPLSYFIAVLGAYIANEVVLPVTAVQDKALIILKLCFIVLSAWFGVNFINSDFQIKSDADTSNTRKTALKFISNILKIAVVTIAALLALEQLGISASKLFAALGIGGVAVAFACKDIVENMLSGFIIIFDKPFEVGDFIELNGDSGTVIDIKIRTTRLLGVDGCEKIYPNTTMANSSITNWTKMQKRAIRETIAVNYSSGAQELSSICDGITELLTSHEDVLKDDIRVNFTEFGSHALEISLFFYTDKIAYADCLKVKNNINIALKDYFDKNNVNLAFESKTLYFGDELKIKK